MSRMEPPAFPEKWTAPPELMRGRPREVRMTGGGKFMAVLGLLFLLGSLPLYVLIHNQDQRTEKRVAALHADGREAQASVVRLWRSSSKGSNRMVSYEFTVEGSVFRTSKRVPSSIWSRLKTGDTLRVRFMPGDPAVNHPLEWEESRTPAWMEWVVAGVFAGIGGMVLTVLQRQKLLLAEGGTDGRQSHAQQSHQGRLDCALRVSDAGRDLG